jgi:diguanylate cyclase
LWRAALHPARLGLLAFLACCLVAHVLGMTLDTMVLLGVSLAVVVSYAVLAVQRTAAHQDDEADVRRRYSQALAAETDALTTEQDVQTAMRDAAGATLSVVDAQADLGLDAHTLLHVTPTVEADGRFVHPEHPSLHDSLTGLANRTLLMDRLRQVILASSHGAGRTLALFVLDIDGFNDVNASLGHAAGDLVLRQVAGRLHEAVRPVDTLARLGSDEFAVVLPGLEAEGAALAADRLLTIFNAGFDVDGHIIFLAGSLGASVYPEHGDDTEALLRHADTAMHRAKASRSGYAVYAPDQDRRSGERLELAGALRQAIGANHLLLEFQPKVECGSGRLAGVEALARWDHPQRGRIAPDVFIPLAERTGLIRPLSRWALNAALRQCHAWQELGLRVPVAVNLSAHDVQDAAIPELIASLLEQWHLEPGLLNVEITESSLLVDPDLALRVLTRLADAAVRVAVDDFGTGYSSLAYLKKLPVHEIKIDQSFVQDMATHTRDLAIVRSTIELAHNLDMVAVAEGVENAATLDLLNTLECDLVQGYYLAKPMPGEALVGWLASSGRQLRVQSALGEEAHAEEHHGIRQHRAGRGGNI